MGDPYYEPLSWFMIQIAILKYLSIFQVSKLEYKKYRCKYKLVLRKLQVGRTQPGLLTALIEYLTVLSESLKLLQSRWQGTAGIWEGLDSTWFALGYATDCDKPNHYEITSRHMTLSNYGPASKNDRDSIRFPVVLSQLLVEFITFL